MRYIIDRFEGEFAVVELENKEMVNLLRILLPDYAKEGDIILVSIDETEVENRKKMIQEKFDSLSAD